MLCDLTRAELLDSPIAGCSVDGQEVLEPGDFGIRVTTGSTEHCGCAGLFHHLQLRAHVNGWEASWEVVFCKRKKHTRLERNAPVQQWDTLAVTAVPPYSICASAGKQQPDFPTEKVIKPLKHIRLYNEHSLHQ